MLRDGAIDRAAYKHDLAEIVDVPSLQRCILPIVGEAQGLARVGLDSRDRR